MNDVLAGLYESHRLLLVLAALGYIASSTRGSLTLPRAAHVLAAAGICLGVTVLALTPADAPVQRDPLGWVKKGAMLAVFPVLVYVCFIVAGGRRPAFGSVPGCRRCGRADGLCPCGDVE